MGDSNSTFRTEHMWGGTFLAALPYLLVAVIVLLNGPLAMAFEKPVIRVETLVEIALAPVVVLMLGLAWWRRWPRWSGSWAGHAIAISFIILLHELTPLLESTLGLNRVLLDPEMGIWLPDAAIWSLWLLASLGGLYLLSRRDPAAGLLTILPVAPLFLNYIGLEFRETDFFLGLTLLVAVLAAAIYRTRRVYLALGIVLAVNVLVGLPGSYMSLLDAPFAGQLTSRDVVRLVLGSLVGYMVWVGPPLLLVLWQALRQRDTLQQAPG